MAGYGLGVDLGTTHTAAAVLVDGRVEVVQLGSRRPEIPSLLFVLPSGDVLIGEAAERRGAAEPERLAREFKRRMGDPVPLLVGGTPHTAHALTAQLLRRVLDIVRRQYDAPPAAVAVTHPANWGPFKRDLLEQVVRLAGADGVTFRPEPEAAAIHYATGERIRPGETVAVYDLGGGTFDVAVLRKTETGFTLLGTPEGIEQLGGIDFDEAVFGHVTATLGDAMERLDPDDEEVTAALARLRRDCIEAKEALTFDTEVMIPVALPGMHTRVRLNRSEFEAMIGPAVAETVAATGRALRTAGVAAEDLRSVVLAGGSSRIPLVSQLLGAEFGRPVAVDPHPEHSIALGAASTTGPTAPRPAVSPLRAVSREVRTVTPDGPEQKNGTEHKAAAEQKAGPEAGADKPAAGRIVATAPVRPSAVAPVEDRRPELPPALTAWVRGVATRLGGKGRWLVAGAAVLALGAPAAVLAWPDSATLTGSPQTPSAAPVADTQPTPLWSYDTGRPVSSRPALAGNALFFGGQDGAVHAVNRVDGRGLWRYPTGGPVGSSPQVRDGVVYAASQDGTVHAIDAADGTLRWKARAGSATTSSPAVTGDTVYIGSDDGLSAYSLAGERRWRFQDGGAMSSAPAVSGGTVYAASDDGQVYAIDAGSGQRRWATGVGGTLSAPVVAGGTVFVGSDDRLVYALDARTGRKRWESPTTAQVAAAPLVAAGTVYFGALDGVVYAVNASDGRGRWQFTVDDGRPVSSSPALAGGVLYVGAHTDRIYALDAATGSKLWDYPTGWIVGGPAQVDAGVLYVGSDDGRMYALRLPPVSVVAPPAATPTPTPSASTSPTRDGGQPKTRPGPARTTRSPSPAVDLSPIPPSTTPPTPPSPEPSGGPMGLSALTSPAAVWSAWPRS